MKVTVIGAGQFGVALANELAFSGQKVTLYVRDRETLMHWAADKHFSGLYDGVPLPRLLTLSSDIKGAVQGADVIVVAVPCAANKSVALQILPHVHHHQKIVLCSKGLWGDQGDLLTSLWERHGAHTDQLLVLSGPGFAKEVIAGEPTCVSLAGRDKKALFLVGALFSGRKFRLYYTTDVVGVQIAGAMKNVFAILSGLVRGLGYGDNASAALLTMGLREMGALVEALGGKRETLLGFSGVGDLLLTATSLQSRNTQFGIALAKTGEKGAAEREVNATIEGVATVAKSLRLAERAGVSLPLVEGLHSVINGYMKADDMIEILFRQVREFENEN